MRIFKLFEKLPYCHTRLLPIGGSGPEGAFEIS